MKYIRKIPLPALLRYNFGDQSEAVRQDVDPRFGCDVRYIRSTKQITGRTFFGCFGKARKEEADCKASRPVVPKAKPYSSTNLVGLKVFWLLDRYLYCAVKMFVTQLLLCYNITVL